MGKSKFNAKRVAELAIGLVVLIIAIGISINKSQDNSNDIMDSLRKCTIMEGADLYTFGADIKSENVFDEARESCLSMMEMLGEETFIEANDIDWENRKDEEIEGKNLEYFLSTLNW